MMRAASTIYIAIYIALGFGLIASPATATCIGSDAFSTCSDNSGNSYTVKRFGNQTFMNGTNSGTGSTWSQHSTSLGNATIHNGESNGNSWNMTDQRFGNMRAFSGTDSHGNSFSYTCGPFGCSGQRSNFDQDEGRLNDRDNDSLSINGDDDLGINSNGNDDSFGLNGDDNDDSLGTNEDDNSDSFSDGSE